MVERNMTPMPTQMLGGRGSGGIEKARMRSWASFTRHQVANLLGGAAHVQLYDNRVGNISAGLSRAECGFASERALRVLKAMVGALSLRLLDYLLPGTPMCKRACARSFPPDPHRHHDRAPGKGTAGIASRVMTCGGGRVGG